MINLKTPISEEDIRKLRCGDVVGLSGIIVTARDAGHKLMVEERPQFLDEYLNGGIIYHCGPVVKNENGVWSFVSAGPTTSIREEPYQAAVIESYHLRGMIGKGGMGAKTLNACQHFGACYFHAIGGAGTLIAKSVKEIINVFKLEEFGTPEAFWVCRAENFPVIVTMDSQGESLHERVEKETAENYQRILSSITA
ncbi:fumarate hydratase C-terminal domain-containing protein [bacterium]|nr:fumarate hydratase C-terminal domain-containing protein [bacterium]